MAEVEDLYSNVPGAVADEIRRLRSENEILRSQLETVQNLSRAILAALALAGAKVPVDKKPPAGDPRLVLDPKTGHLRPRVYGDPAPEPEGVAQAQQSV